MRTRFLLVFLMIFISGIQAVIADRLVWTGNVFSNGQQTQQIRLSNGNSYYIVVKGTVVFGKWQNNGRTLINDACYEFNAKGYLDPLPVFQNNYNVSVCNNKYNPNNTYQSAPFSSNGSPIYFWIYDSDYRDNSGSLQVEIYEIQRGNSLLGTVNQLVGKVVNAGHQVQCWKVLPDYSRTGRWRLSMQHAAAGGRGGFHLMAWADTNGDGIPDLEIGRSMFAVSNQAGAWSSWEFVTNYHSIFIGNSWPQQNDSIYYQSGGRAPGGYVGLGNTLYYSRKFNGMPSSTTGPRFTNIRLEYLGY